MAFDLPPLRIALYGTLALFSLVLFGLSAARLRYTTHLPPGDPLNGGTPFYDPIVAEILFTTLMTMAWSIFIIHAIHKRAEHRFVSRFRDEIIGLAILWLFWIIGAGIATSIWGDLSFCQEFRACRILTALVAFCWLGWIILTIILGVTLLFAFANRAFVEPLHGRWDPRASHYRDSRA
ncbi:hypothetical protein BDQ12DRAFT_653179 [Crucibulum laeve]|uniref:MARVEL domain-containing protein n=1 Tax=Crucibulum laeve TaxID=68775 RepID=A0A5C3LY02_9AGAR|nr:hypothetical protein BDQ12DRAFT_653179 [Crucibulum laeve]